jgi:hypothetical protein
MFLAGFLALALGAVDPTAATGAIAGYAEPKAQIIVTGIDNGKPVVGVVSSETGDYRVENLPPGRYMIKQQGKGHAARTLSVNPGETAQVDLAPDTRQKPKG